MRYLMDTNVFLWYISGDNRLPPDYKKIINDVDSDLWISIASLWELTIKVSKKSIELEYDLEKFIRLNIIDAGIKILPIEVPHLLQLLELPFYHRDPFDRLIYVQSLLENMVFLYTDTIFNQYRNV